MCSVKLCNDCFLSALTVAVFLVEKSGRLLNLEEGKNTVAGTINTIMSENLSLPPVASQVFCVWLISPLLREYILIQNSLSIYSFKSKSDYNLPYPCMA